MKKITIDELGQINKKAQTFLLETDLKRIPIGKIDLGNGYSVNVEIYQTVFFETKKYESHRKYIDLQYIVQGQEKIIVAPVDKLEIVEKYNPQKDIIFYKNNFQGEMIYLNTGEMLILYPKDGHIPCVAATKPAQVKKIVIKLPVEQVKNEKN